MISEVTFRWGLHSLNVAFNREPNPDVETLYSKALQELTEDAFRGAVHEVIQAERFFPTPAVLLEAGRMCALRDRSEERQITAYAEMYCSDCDGTGFEPFERGGHRWVRRCLHPAEALRKRQTVTHEFGMEVFRRELTRRGMDVDSLVAKLSMPGTPKLSRDRVPGEEG